MDNTKRIFLWSGPRNISTTMMYSFAQRHDCKVFDEPLYGAYLKETPANTYHPDAKKILSSMECDKHKVVEAMLADYGSKELFFKNMTHHLMDLNKDFLSKGFNILLTRNPKDMIPSFDKVIPNPSLLDIGYKQHADLLEYLKKNKIPYAVLDAKETLLNPETVLRKLCEKAKLSFEPGMLEWRKGPRPEDGIWAKHWYESVHQSTGFNKFEEKNQDFPDRLIALLEEAQPYYDLLYKEAIKAD